MLRSTLCLVYLLSSFALFAQTKFNFEWVTAGLYSSVVSYNNTFKFDRFIDTATGDATFYFAQGHSNICDSNGHLQLMSNGYNVMDKNKNYVDGLDSIGGRLFMEKNDGFAVYLQYSIFLPMFEEVFYFVSSSVSDIYWNYYLSNPQAKALFDELMYCKIDMKGNGGAGKVLEREVKIIAHDTLSKTQMIACKHANGNDWWLLKQAREKNIVFKFLFTQDSVFNKGIQQFAMPLFSEIDNAGQSMFSQDGSKYATTCSGTGKIFVADFDRCTGMLSNPLVYDVDTLSMHNPFNSGEQDMFTQGLAFSPNGRFIYVYMAANIQQLDLWDTNPATQWSVVAELDTTWDAFNSYSGMFLGPDGKLYVGNWGGLSKQMSYFNNPNAKGLLSDFCPRCLRFPKVGVTSPPNMPNYDLGPTGQPCWPLQNEHVNESENELLVYPNPAHNRLYIQTESKGERMLFNALGQLVQGTHGNELDVSALSAGVYWLRVGNRVKKVVVE